MKQIWIVLSCISIIFFSFEISGIDNTFDIRLKNIQSDKKFLEKVISNKYIKISEELKNLLNSNAQEFLAKKTQVDLLEGESEQVLTNKINQVTKEFFQTFFPTYETGIYDELKQFIKLLMKPEVEVFSLSHQDKGDDDKLYKEFMEKLSKINTPAGTTLHQWATRYLSSEVLLSALDMIEKLKELDKPFFDLDVNKKKEILGKAVSVVFEQFIRNLKDVEKNYKIEVPKGLDSVIEQKLNQFLLKKFNIQ